MNITRITQNGVFTQDDNGNWIPAEPLSYYPNPWERLTHYFGKHWYYQAGKCVMCGKKEKSNV